MAESEGETVDELRALFHARYCGNSEQCCILRADLDRLIDAAQAEVIASVLVANDIIL